METEANLSSVVDDKVLPQRDAVRTLLIEEEGTHATTVSHIHSLHPLILTSWLRLSKIGALSLSTGC